MKHLGEYKAYQLYELEQEEVERIGSVNNRYIKNTVLVFRPNDPHLKIGDEWGSYEKAKDAEAAIDKDIGKPSMQDQLRAAEIKSKELEIAAELQRNITAEEERRRRERRQDEYHRQKYE